MDLDWAKQQNGHCCGREWGKEKTGDFKNCNFANKFGKSSSFTEVKVIGWHFFPALFYNPPRSDF